MADFSLNLKRLRKKSNLSQDALAEQLCVSRQTVSSWERGKSYPDLDILMQISEILHTTPNELLYPPLENKGSHTNEIFRKGLFNKVAFAVFICGFGLGLYNGSQAYASAPNTLSWHFIFSDALKYWVPALLMGLLSMGLQTVLSLLYEIKDNE
ncbi:MAG: helix-turn-helix domain-containing protein [Firmicutes bacterium]|nr:helix-turn-helix domain-containing protein [Bacillota bacterium]